MAFQIKVSEPAAPKQLYWWTRQELTVQTLRANIKMVHEKNYLNNKFDQTK